MKKLNVVLILLILLSLTFDSCDKLGIGVKQISYRCENNTSSTVTLVYLGADGNNVFDNVKPGPGRWWSAFVDFKKGDYVSIQAQCNATKGEVLLEIRCEGCENIGKSRDERLSKSIDLSVTNIVELTATLQ